MAEWRDVVGYEGLYQVSNLGRVRSLGRIIYWRGTSLFREGRIMTPRINKYGYFQLTLTKDKKHKTHTVHRLVAEAFIPNPDNLPQVNHKDENKLNNCIDNLEWCDSPNNCNYGTRNKRISASQINDKNKSKPILQYTLSNFLLKEYKSIHEANRDTGIDRKDISYVCNNKCGHKTAGGYIWKYKEPE